MGPLVFTPYLRPAVWGGRRLQERLKKPLPTGGTWGESWEVSVHPTHVSVVSEGPLRGRTLTDVCRLDGRALFGGSHTFPQFPLLLKYLDAREWLSVQVHPNDELAPQLAGEPLGKTEAWVVLDVQPGGRIYAGLQPGVGREQMETALAAGRVTDCLHVISPQPGDCLFLRPGTVHAVGGGVLLAEVQQSSDATLRLFDWGRPGSDGKPRPLHIPQALAAIDWHSGPVEPVRGRSLTGLDGDVQGERLVDCSYFVLDRFELCRGARSPFAGRLSVWMLLDGQADLLTETGYCRPCGPGDTILVPAASAPARWVCQKPTMLLGVTLP